MNTSGKEAAAEALQKLVAECPRGGSGMPEAHSLGAYVHVALNGDINCMAREAYNLLWLDGMGPPLTQTQQDFNTAIRRASFKLVPNSPQE